jgi:hypothetical protein
MPHVIARRRSGGHFRPTPGNPPGDAGTTHVPLPCSTEVVGERRSRPDQAHVAADGVEGSGQLVEAPRSERSAERREPVAIGEFASLRIDPSASSGTCRERRPLVEPVGPG